MSKKALYLDDAVKALKEHTFDLDAAVSPPILGRRFRPSHYFEMDLAPLTAAVAALSQSVMKCIPFSVGVTTTFDRIGIFHGSNVVGSTYRMGIYEDDGAGLPGALILDAGTVATSASANTFLEVTISQQLTPGLYWLAGVSQGGNPTMGRYTTGPAVGPQLGEVSGIGPSITDRVAGHVRSAVTGALPNPAGVSSRLFFADFVPSICMRAA
jgi:hypothetical protein